MYVHCIQSLGCFAIRNHVQPMQGNPRQYWILDSTSWIPDFQVVDFSLCRWNVDLQIAIVGGIPDSLSCIPDSKAQDLGFKSKFSQILDPTRKTFLDSGMRIPLHQAASSLFPAFRSCGVWPEIRERETITNKTLRSVHFGAVIAELIYCKCGGIVRNEIW